jgi:AraC-like DNA-binding protein
MTTRLPVPVSFEFFPPNTPVGSEKLKTVVADLAATRPEFFSVTYGAGGSTREKTLSTVKEIATRHGLSLSTVYRDFKGKLGCFRFRGKWVVTETLYTRWLTDCVLESAD